MSSRRNQGGAYVVIQDRNRKNKAICFTVYGTSPKRLAKQIKQSVRDLNGRVRRRERLSMAAGDAAA